MIKDIAIDQYIPGETPVHRLDPRAKILLSILFIISLFVVDKFIGYILIIGILALTVYTAELQPRYLYRGLGPVFLLIIFTTALSIFMIRETTDTMIFELSFVEVYEEGLRTAAFMTLRLTFLIMSTSALMLTTSLVELTDDIESLLRPIGKEVARGLAMMMIIALRFIPTLMDEIDKIMMTQKAKGADFETGGIIQKAKGLIPLLVSLFIDSFRRADEFAVTMEARAYGGGNGRTRMKQSGFTNRDTIAFAVFSILFIGNLLARLAM